MRCFHPGIARAARLTDSLEPPRSMIRMAMDGRSRRIRRDTHTHRDLKRKSERERERDKETKRERERDRVLKDMDEGSWVKEEGSWVKEDRMKHVARDVSSLKSQLSAQCTSGLVAMTSASHAEGRQFDPGLVYFSRVSVVPAVLDVEWANLKRFAQRPQ